MDNEQLPSTGRHAQRAGCAWLAFTGMLLFIAAGAGGAGIDPVPVVAPWLAIVLVVIVWLFLRPRTVLAAAASLAASLGSIAFCVLATLQPNAGDLTFVIILIAILALAAVFSGASLIRAIRSSERRYL